MRIPDKAAFSRRRFCRLLAAAPLIVVLQKEGAPLPAPVPHVLGDADILQAQGIRLLRQGLRFERAARYLALAAEKEPTNPGIHLALGCAYASRAASLAYAVGFAFRLNEARAKIDETIQKWEEIRDEIRAAEPQYFNAAEYEKPVRYCHPCANFGPGTITSPIR